MKTSFKTILIIALLAVACKKTKETEVIEPTPPAKTISVKVDGTLKMNAAALVILGQQVEGHAGFVFF